MVLSEGWCGKGGHSGVGWALLKHYYFTAEHDFNECQELNIKNPLFTLMADFCVGGVCRGAG